MAASNVDPIPNSASPPTDEIFGVEDFQWDPQNPKESFQRLYAHDVAFAKRKMRWYFSEAEKNGRHSQWVRLFVTCLATLGALCPLLQATGVQWSAGLSPWGYVLFALGTGVFAVDRFYGLSTGWTRNTATWLGIRKALVAFEHEWVISPATQPSNWSEGVKMLKKFRENVEAAVIAETAVWIAEEERARRALQASLDRASPPGD